MDEDTDQNELMRAGGERSPFCRGRLCCPVCTDDFDYEFIDPACFKLVSAGHGTKPAYAWKRRLWGRLIPEMFFVIRCPQCGFCSSTNGYTNPVGDLNILLPLFRRRMKKVLAEKPPGLDLLLREEKIGKKSKATDFVAAVKKHLAAILLMKQFKNVHSRDSLRPARLCLHLSWLLTDINRCGAGAAAAAALELLRSELASAGENTLPLTAGEAGRQALEYYTGCFYLSAIPEQRRIEHHILMIMARLSLLYGDPRGAADLTFKCIRLLDKKAAGYRRQMNSGDPDVQLAARTAIVDLNKELDTARELLEEVKGKRHSP